jgi:shikimate kinase
MNEKTGMTDFVLQKAAGPGLEAAIVAALGQRSVVLVGMMGAGKSSVGRRLAARLGLGFIDADTEIEVAAGMPIHEIFASNGESYFRAGEARVIARLLEHGPQVLATGGGAVMDENTRALIAKHGISIWLKANAEVLHRRTKRRNDRPLADKIATLLPQREPFYALSDITVQSREEPHEAVVEEIVMALANHLGAGTENSQ